ncbi:hypothetical protein GOP47_0029336 [Adiantum capillus-veneris]|nr:hypothetical protein GOP47_0029336 [Adiantum capillus-veneris]
MELSKAQRALLSIPSRWPPILLGIILSLFISAICTSNFAMRVIPTSESTSPASSPSSSITTISSVSGRMSPSSMPLPTSSSPSEDVRGEDNGTNNAISTEEAAPLSHEPEDVGSSSGSNADAKVAPVINNTRATDSVDLAMNDSIGLNTTESALSSEKQHEAELPDQAGPSSSLLVNDSQALVAREEDKSTTLDDKSSSASQRAPATNAKLCDLSMGEWVEDDSYPLYRPSSCPYVDEGFSCQQNGRPDSKYNKWRWAPRDCNVPRFNGAHLLEMLRGKRMVFVGDSLNRNQWESMLCMLRESLPDKSRIMQVHGGRISKLPGAYVFKFVDYDCKVEFYTSPYLVDKEDGLNQTDFRVRLDRMDKAERRWRKANVLVFNTGHWWTADKIGEGDNRFQEGLEVHKKMSVSVAYSKALATWAKWVSIYVNPQNTTVFFRGYSPVHYIGGQWNSGGQCHDETEPIFDESFLTPYPDKMKALDEILQGIKLPVQVLNVTRLSDFRKDAHPAVYGHPVHRVVQYQDCSHWCLPGLPDTWNELLYFTLVNQAGLA